jgi:hypothetical protein
MAAPLLGLASILGREYANTLPTYKEREDFLKVVSPQTYYTNQLIEYLTDKFGIYSSLPNAQNTIDRAGRTVYNNTQGMSQEEYDRQMADMQARISTPEYAAMFENRMRDDAYGTINPVDPQYVGPQTEDSVTFQLGEAMLPRRLDSVPVESNFTPAQLEILRDRIYGTQEQTGPQQELVFPSGPGGEFAPVGGAGGDFMPQGGGDFMPQDSGGFMPQGGGKDNFDVQQEYEQYLRGGLIQRRR